MPSRPILTADLPLRIARRVKYEASLYLCYYPHEIFHRLSARFSWRSGVTAVKRKQPLIISLTTIPERFAIVHMCIDTLLRQSLKPDRIILWLSESDAPGRQPISKQSVPMALTRLQHRGLEIRWCEDIRSHRKIIPTLKAYPEALVVTADDDCLYPRHWLRDLYEAYFREPQYIHCHRAHMMRHDENGSLLPYLEWDFETQGDVGPSLLLFPTGNGGVLYAPGHLHPEVLNDDAIRDICPGSDDVWLKAMSLKAGVLCSKVYSKKYKIITIRNSQTFSLQKHWWSPSGGRRSKKDELLRTVFDRYGLWEKLSCSREMVRQ